MIENLCARCEAPTPDGYVCTRCTQNLAADLTRAAGHADDAPAVVARQVRYGPGGGRGDEQPLPYDPVASERLWGVENTITTWARHVAEERGIEITFDGPGVITDGRNPLDPYSPLGGACRWLTGHVDWLRHRPEAAEAFDELDDACTQLRRLVDRPADRVIVGPCTCGRVLYALEGRAVVTCPDCETQWNVAEQQTWMRNQVEDRLARPVEISGLLLRLGFPVGYSTIAAYAAKGQLTSHGNDQKGRPLFRIGDVMKLRIEGEKPRRSQQRPRGAANPRGG